MVTLPFLVILTISNVILIIGVILIHPRSRLAIVSQEPVLFNKSIADNIRWPTDNIVALFGAEKESDGQMKIRGSRPTDVRHNMFVALSRVAFRVMLLSHPLESLTSVTFLCHSPVSPSQLHQRVKI